MRHWFSPPQREDAYEMFAARVLHFTLLLLLAATLVFAPFASSPAQLIFIPVVLGMFGGCYYLLHTGHYRLASRIFTSGLWIVITLASFSINGIRNASLSSYAIVIIFSAVLLSSRAAGLFTIISILSAVILAVGETAGVLPLRTTPLFLADRFFQLLALFGATGVLLSAASRVIRANYTRVRKHEQSLLERNQALEVEIAERRRTEASLRISEENYRLLFENIPVMAAVYAQDGEIILMNNATARFLGATPETLQGRNLRDVIRSDIAELGIRDQAQVMEEGKEMLTEGKLNLLNGREFYYLRHIMPLPNASRPSQVLVLTTDLTEKHVAEQRERELALAQEKNAFLTDFFSTVSHDLKTPLTTMNTSLYLLQRAQTPRQQQERIARIGEQIALMDKYIQDMLAISRLEHLPTFNFQDVDLNSLIGEIVDLLRMRIEGKHIIQKVIAQPGLPVIQGDPEQLRRMLINLIENAVNYTPDGGQITVTTLAIKGSVTLEVRDSGIGIEPDAIPHIFERFFRTSKAKAAQSSGTGLGLTIVKKIVETHSASIEVRSQPEQGTTFLVQFPAAFPNNNQHASP